MVPRIHTGQPLAAGADIELEPVAARHVQVLRLQPGDTLTLFNGQGGQWQAQVSHMGRSAVRVQALAHEAQERELAHAVTLALGMPANDRMDALVEKATELGVAAIQPLVCERSVLRLAGERAERKAQHWQAVAVAACEQCGRNRVPAVAPPLPLPVWLANLATGPRRLLLSLEQALPWREQVAASGDLLLLSGPEGGLSATEEVAARAAGFLPVSLGARVLRADTAPLAALAHLGLELA
jgi:16S rRNA (uracil1498-N3)-methyltransferase